MCLVLYETKDIGPTLKEQKNLKSKMDRGKPEVLGKHRREEEARAERVEEGARKDERDWQFQAEGAACVKSGNMTDRLCTG